MTTGVKLKKNLQNHLLPIKQKFQNVRMQQDSSRSKKIGYDTGRSQSLKMISHVQHAAGMPQKDISFALTMKTGSLC